MICLQGDNDKFLIKPLKYPILLSKNHYKFSKIGHYHNSFVCNGVTYYLEYYLQHRVIPSGKLRCFVQIFINPVPCTTISSKLNKRKGREDSRFMRPTYDDLSTIFYYGLFEENPEYEATKCCTFYLHIELHKPDWVHHLENTRKGTVHYIDLWYNSGTFLNQVMYSNPSRITFWIEYSVETKSFKVTLKTLIGCNDYKSSFENIQRYCKTYLKSESQLRKCVLKASEKLPLLSTVVNFDKYQKD